MKITLLHPPQRVSPTNYLSTIVLPPLGLAYVAAALEAAGHEVNAVDAIGSGIHQVYPYDCYHLRGLDHVDTVRRIPEDTELIGVGCMFSCQWPSTRELIHRVRERFPGIPIVAGGEHPTALPELTLEQAPVDYIVLGEGEQTIAELAGCLSRGEPPGPEFPGIAYRVGGGIQVNRARPRIRDIDTIAPPSWHLFDVKTYLDYDSPHGAARGRYMPMLATRGCPYQCTFCTSPQMWTTAWVARDPDRVIDEIERYQREHGAKDFHFEDLTAVVRKDWVLQFARRLQERGLSISWQLPSGTRSEAIDRECADAMYRSGCRLFSYAVESGSKETLTLIKKKIHLDKVFESARHAIDAGIRVQFLFIYGFPHERAGHLWKTYRTILKSAWCGIHEVAISAFFPLPNTEAFHLLSRERPIPLTDEYFRSLSEFIDLRNYKSWNPRLGDRRLQLLILFSYLSFFALSFLVRPWRLADEILGLCRRRSPGKVGKHLQQMARNYRTLRKAPALADRVPG